MAAKKPIKKAPEKPKVPSKLIIDEQLPVTTDNIKKLVIFDGKKKVREVKS